jgi:hypothetical protein
MYLHHEEQEELNKLLLMSWVECDMDEVGGLELRIEWTKQFEISQFLTFQLF